MDFFLLRLVTGSFAWCLAEWLNLAQVVGLIFALTLSHNTLAFAYSSQQRGYLKQNWKRHLLPLVLIGSAVFATCWYGNPPVYFLFALHHMFNETYLSQERFKQRDGVLAFARASLHFVCYFTLTRLNLSYFVPVFDKALFACTLLAATGFVLFILAKKWNEESRADLLNELLLPAITAWSLATKSLTVDHLVLYHFIFWALHPIPRLKKQSKLLSYLGWTSILSGVAALFTPLGPHWGNITVAGMSYLIGLASFFHFFSSFALSRSHPEWIKRWFFPKAATVVAIASPKTFSKSA